MNIDLEWISSADKLLGFIVFLVSVAIGIGAWLRRRGRNFVGDEVAPLLNAQGDQGDRLDKVEKRLVEIEGDVSSLDGRILQIERALPNLATKEDLTSLRIQGAETNATLIGIGNKVDTLYRAALAANRRDDA